MGNSNNKSKEEEIDWDALEAEDKRNAANLKEEEVDQEKIDSEKKHLSKEEKSSPYPDDFLAEINIIRKDYDDALKNDDIEEEDL
ncbi:hypothetical protein KMW28_14485 [Flammeovirga yaeyamensis]|uniref:Uncharacterized protein n=1 Tax=Flammeovirga yaeyamensis TaxID=367791 RepID=A0AAX1N420_9BACT|nr:hypothetical protein [Flammeovirga yaeyamensis]MBB3700201.1 hypothetical protein [Flammeovirga yaeyamensis]NMF37169.1 hypothetical protein [Flammeovirga yaeyamensis]QWG00860.1 hypothetical protein KMW28_14485 [Flammeovirga yaeyamensis]